MLLEGKIGANVVLHSKEDDAGGYLAAMLKGVTRYSLHSILIARLLSRYESLGKEA